MSTISKVIEGRRVSVNAGDVVQLDFSGRTEKLLESDWDAAHFRFPVPIQEWREKHAIAIRVEITGVSFQWRQGSYSVRLRITWVGDYEPDEYCGAWLLIDPFECPRVESVT